MTQPPDTRSAVPLVVGLLAGAVHLVVGYFYLAGGLVIPGPVLIALWLVWLVMAALLARWALRGSWWTPVIPVAAAALLVLVLAVGDRVLGWQA
ncbi:hypothetical protein DQ244_18495 [Blastococcus sp. TBT05-19]|uniref:hypothetical protein n=1 Tax=Blastococcus sp. TBT05-19 TaxID=2250581 RepID=UPI000DE90C43|nr:hypothetical protein [Blastococcus sp. TBT05-19]RBY86670.1 hypothetical protein DQ244_18495 [Blastococcus sp. TBT05-19]